QKRKDEICPFSSLAFLQPTTVDKEPNRLEKMGCFIYYSYLNEDKKKVYSRHSHNLYVDYKF
ncbi:hypothetical protein RKR89_00085, partial [Streptococcus pneumoniae]|nr:hypothetical protein [Streptococcus pneumoniae]MDS3774299.1 hypothetical protein [Streptococcus pneumoniae]MDS4521027.1 hypothetical protein [Streptococcus pneumoniae]MDS4592494.1 hypothetical protein [Streptococcus pneumoniae]MDS4755379.1 hypothetical protein [Streptococcus pneumoniae]